MLMFFDPVHTFLSRLVFSETTLLPIEFLHKSGIGIEVENDSKTNIYLNRLEKIEIKKDHTTIVWVNNLNSPLSISLSRSLLLSLSDRTKITEVSVVLLLT